MSDSHSKPGHRERLLEAAIVCLEERGYAHTTARDLVAESGTNLASIGYHFGSKEHLLNVALTEAFRRWLVPIVALAAAPGQATPLERLERSLVGAIESLQQNRGLASACLEAWAQAPRSEDLRAELNATHGAFRRAIADVTRDAFADAGTRDGIDAEALAVLFIAIFDGLLVRAQLDPAGVPSGYRLLGAAAGALAALTAAGDPGAVSGSGRTPR